LLYRDADNEGKTHMMLLRKSPKRKPEAPNGLCVPYAKLWIIACHWWYGGAVAHELTRFSRRGPWMWSTMQTGASASLFVMNFVCKRK